MKQILRVSLVFLSLYVGTGQGQETGSFATSVFDQDNNPYQIFNPNNNPYRVPVTIEIQGFLDNTDIAMGTILKSHHFNNEDYNETHNGIYFSVDKWSVGTYKNSSNVQSNFVMYNAKMYSTKSLKLDLVTGVADGYEGWNYAQGEYLPIVGVSALWMNVRTMVSFDVLAFGLEVPLN